MKPSAMAAILIIAILTAYTVLADATETNPILWLVSGSGDGRIYGAAPNTDAFKSAEYRTELQQAFEKASDRYAIPVGLLVAMGYYESIFRNVKGDSGRSWGIMQVGRQGRHVCKCDMATIEGQIMCGACWLDKGRKWCGSTEGALSAYACGKCQPVNMATKRAVKLRVEMGERLGAM